MKELTLTQEELDALGQLRTNHRFAVRNVVGRQTVRYDPAKRKYVVLSREELGQDRSWQSQYVFNGAYEGESDAQQVIVPHSAYEYYQACVTRSPRAVFYALSRFPGGGYDCEALYD